jgi:2-keto-4-pentenoate hydratase/2-oxohepta-3-ene-1,7-dioic acid hydratase in catechol pathway
MELTKVDALDADALTRTPLPGGMLEPRGGGNYSIEGDLEWFSDVRADGAGSFVGIRDDDGAVRYARVLECDPDADRLRVAWLPAGASPVSAGAGPGPGAPGEDLVLSSLIAEARFAPPIPPPARVYAVVSNFRSHLVHDLRFDEDDVGDLVEAMGATRPRVFLKYPTTAAPGSSGPERESLPGAFDGITFPSETALPSEEDLEQGGGSALTRLDYEVELGVVIGRDLSWDDVQGMDDAAIVDAIAGTLLVSDVKSRNPQVFGRAYEKDLEPRIDSTYRMHDAEFAERFGQWDETICLWWSHAASNGPYAALGPVFAAGAFGGADSHLLLAGRSYADAADRPFPPPPGVRADRLYVRQLASATFEETYADAMIWSIPDVVRSILDPRDNALAFMKGGPRLERGDVIALGTPGGVVLTAPSDKVSKAANFVLFWFSPLDWHNAFFKKTDRLYLQPGDQVFFWGEGLGFQRHRIEQLD